MTAGSLEGSPAVRSIENRIIRWKRVQTLFWRMVIVLGAMIVIVPSLKVVALGVELFYVTPKVEAAHVAGRAAAERTAGCSRPLMASEVGTYKVLYAAQRKGRWLCLLHAERGNGVWYYNIPESQMPLGGLRAGDTIEVKPAPEIDDRPLPIIRPRVVHLAGAPAG